MNKNTIRTVLEQQPDDVRQAETVLQGVLARSATDAGFRGRLLSAPRTAIAEYTGQPAETLDAELGVVFIENRAAATIVLPDFVGTAELSEEELEAVAGGTDPLTTAVLSAVAAGAALVGAGLALYNAIRDHSKPNDDCHQ